MQSKVEALIAPVEPTTRAAEVQAHEDEGTRALVLRARAGDRHAFALLVRKYDRRALTTAWRILGNREDAFDATQEAFVRLFRFLDRIDDSRDVGAWIYRIVVNACYDLLKARKRTDDLRVQVERIGPGEEPAVDEALDHRREGERVLAAIAQLPLKERTALVLRDLEGLPTAEVAKILQSSEVTVRSQICAARAKLRAIRACAATGDKGTP